LELSWSTFVLEIINFLILVWILKRFLYKPVLEVINRRRAGIEKSMADAETLHSEAKKLQEQYEDRLADWDRERQKARKVLNQEVETERADKLVELQSTLEQEREKAQVAEAHRQADDRRKMEATALLHGARFATQLLEQGSGPDTEARLVDLVITKLAQLPAKQIASLRNGYGKRPETVVVVSSFPLPDDQRQRIEQALATITDPNIPVRFEQNSELLAGVRITIGAWILGVNLRDELNGFVELAHNE